jgi:hypothetical protein
MTSATHRDNESRAEGFALAFADDAAWSLAFAHFLLGNDKDYLPRFPFLAPAHQGLLQGHGGINVPTVPNIPTP